MIEDQTGWLVEPYTTAAMVEKLVALFSEPLPPKARLKDRLAEFVQNRLTLSRMVTDFGVVDHFLRSHCGARRRWPRTA